MSTPIPSMPSGKQRDSLQRLGFTSIPTHDFAYANWSGHGIELSLWHQWEPADDAAAVAKIIDETRRFQRAATKEKFDAVFR